MSTIRQGSICINEKGELGLVTYESTNYVRGADGNSYEAYIGYVMRGTFRKDHRAPGSQWQGKVGETIAVAHVSDWFRPPPDPDPEPEPDPRKPPEPRPGVPYDKF